MSAVAVKNGLKGANLKALDTVKLNNNVTSHLCATGANNVPATKLKR